ncbi:hypothetical protein JB92DRAFT_3119585 [Gautieria morchelliformis]|nr:hypothetical protein JB92DRAFT_3119585 [Gautieria morchelliformis]
MSSSPRPPFSVAVFKAALVNWIVADDQSINVVECPEFRHLVFTLRESLSEKDIPHRTAIWNLVTLAWNRHFAELKSELEHTVGKISLTIDLWDNKGMRAFSAVTAHYLQSSLSNTEVITDRIPPSAWPTLW